MTISLFQRAKRPALWLTMSGLVACSHEAPTPTGSISGQMAPVAAVGHLLAVVAAGGGTEYHAQVDPRTGAFSLAVPAGKYQLKFTTVAPGGTPQSFPQWVPVTVVAGTTVTPAIPPITHDGIGRGLLRWTLDGKQYTARSVIQLNGAGKYFRLWGRSEEFGAASDVKEVGLLVPEQTDNGPLFAGPGTYSLGGSGRITAYGDCFSYPTNRPEINWRYVSTHDVTPTGTAQLTRYDAERGIATGTFAFKASWSTGALLGTPAPTVTVTNGEFDLTF